MTLIVLPLRIFTCANPVAHRTMHNRQEHHHPPTAWRRKILELTPLADQSWWRMIDFCGFDHDEYHTLLDEHVRYAAAYRKKKLPLPVPLLPAVVTRTYGFYVKEVVFEAWDHRPSDDPPFTVAAA